MILLGLIGIPMLIQVILTLAVYADATSVGMDPNKWALVTLLVPIYGLFLYLLERSERFYDPKTDPYAEGGYNFHETDEVNDTIEPNVNDVESSPRTDEGTDPNASEKTCPETGEKT